VAHRMLEDLPQGRAVMVAEVLRLRHRRRHRS
jgi:hypothetical protein